MLLHRLRLKNFRNYKDRSVEFAEGINYICGGNASGKTTLLEGLFFLTTGRSFRTHNISDLIRHGTDHFFLEITFEKSGVMQKLSCGYDGKTRTITHNETRYNRFTALLGILQGVVLTPEDNALVKGAPSIRRRYLDIAIAQVDPFYLRNLLRYQRAMLQRNRLLRDKEEQTIVAWEGEMAKAASFIIERRSEKLLELERQSADVYATLVPNQESIGVRYMASVGSEGAREVIEERMKEKLAQYRTREYKVGTTLSGPHKDDILITLDTMPARYYASEGQQRTCASALKFAEWRHLRDEAGCAPWMAIDDIGVSLDEARMGRLLEQVKLFQQVFVTAPDERAIAAAHTIKV
ncbi:DNA replication/repair protein RecF [Simkania negevensis]|uniref:DNA replication and repair protein RecF n=1 Tax=Simkania negevensis TaxID=83561 RepID=A0ABS3ARY5_9BACT|nr:DNA replication/repair protein RecF [Simkania negevensis]